MLLCSYKFRAALQQSSSEGFRDLRRFLSSFLTPFPSLPSFPVWTVGSRKRFCIWKYFPFVKRKSDECWKTRVDWIEIGINQIVQMNELICVTPLHSFFYYVSYVTLLNMLWEILLPEGNFPPKYMYLLEGMNGKYRAVGKYVRMMWLGLLWFPSTLHKTLRLTSFILSFSHR